ncbi:biotin/lipoyl-containing protein [Lewinella sp. 4G2]|uniref:biotin/lipoyl-containing protein n=1 Tax=Lewinella sp. 4G2 TaxID=1803372 RepID=UPI0007B47F1D|nr:acetyl-CoA carboxylase biotin carboxyl carrier protein subunit [Lewinella sp. 4G2]OAV46135.1 hypothetical protein A3850_017905 [Lewinella sp. 4G2]
MPTYTTQINGRTYAVPDAELAAADLHTSPDGKLHLLHQGRSFAVEVLSIDRVEKTVTLSLNQQNFTVALRDEIDQQIDALGYSSTETVVSKDVMAPMPGLVLDVLVAEGQEVAAGTPLIILEAMKMENVLKAEGDGTVGKIHAEKGAAVEKKELLISID